MAPSAVQEQAPDAISDAKPKAVVDTAQKSRIEAALAAAQARFEEKNPFSKKQHELAVQSLPGGNTRTLLYSPPFPLVMKCGKGAYVWSEDGHKYLDFVGELTAGLYGHSHPVIREAIVDTFDNVGVNLGATTVQEARYAALLCERFGLDRVRFTNSGTEANLHALNGARRFTGRRRVAVFGGGYHGAVLSFGDGRVAPNDVDHDDWVIARYNDPESAREVIEGTPGGLAAVIVEPMQGSGGCIPATREFMQQVQESARRAGALFILDEVMTSRLSPGGLGRSGALGPLAPDMITFGKYLGGGFAFGGFGGRADVMAVYDPRVPGALVHSGTFNNNTMAMHAGYAGLSRVLTPEVTVAFNAKGDRFRRRLQEASRGTKLSFTGVGSLMMAHFSDSGREGILRAGDIVERQDLKDLFWFDMMEQGYWIHRRGSISLILETPDEELDRFVECVTKFLDKYKDLMVL